MEAFKNVNLTAIDEATLTLTHYGVKALITRRTSIIDLSWEGA